MSEGYIMEFLLINLYREMKSIHLFVLLRVCLLSVYLLNYYSLSVSIERLWKYVFCRLL